MFMGLFASAGLCIAPAAISDMFFLHEKGKRMGVYTFMLVCAPYAGGIAGGAVQFNKALGWRWSMYVAAILYAALLLLMIVFGTLLRLPVLIFLTDLCSNDN
jgi:MFS family permease